MSLASLLASLLGGDEAEAKQFYVSESGKVPKDIPLKFTQKSLADVLGKEPESAKEYKQLLADVFKRRMEYNSTLPDNEKMSTGDLINRLNNDLMKASLGKLGTNKLQDVVPNLLNAYGVSPEQQAKMNQMYILDPTQLKPGSSFLVKGKTNVSLSEPLGTGIGGLKTSKANLTKPNIDIGNTFGAPIKVKGSDDPSKISPLSRVRTYVNTPEDSGVMEEAAAVMGHELSAHALNPEADSTEEDYGMVLPKDTPLKEALLKTGFMGHIPQGTLDNEPIYGMYERFARINHPEWFSDAKKEALLKMASPTPAKEE